ncbi:MAG: hypothetical protein OER95_05510 [Acidimicrobiia bacterium]|nr:hypothetical protein [Acidimicrobiia bacterium]
MNPDEAIGTSVPIAFYLIYATITLGLVVWLARTLFQAGNQFLEDVFDSKELGFAVNRLLVIGFYLLNLGYAFLLYQLDPTYGSVTDAWNQLVNRLGVLFLSLGVIHLFNMLVLWRVRTHRERRAQVPVAPSGFHPPPPPIDTTTTPPAMR